MNRNPGLSDHRLLAVFETLRGLINNKNYCLIRPACI